MPEPSDLLFEAVGSSSPASHMIGRRLMVRRRNGVGAGVVTVMVRVARSAVAEAPMGTVVPRCCEPLAGSATKLMLFATVCAVSRSEEHTSELQSLMRISYAVFCLKKKKTTQNNYKCHKIM